MKKNKKLAYLAILLIMTLLGTGFTLAQEGETALQGLLDQQVKEQDILGMAMAVRLADGTVIGKASGYSDSSGENAWSVDTVAAIASVTKTYAAVVVMQLVEEGNLSLDDTIDTWFPEQPNGDKITVRMLLSHTSGLAHLITGENVMEGKWAKEWAPMDLVAETNKLGPVGEPGSREAHYSSTNYFLLGLIIENITGNSWAQEVKSRIVEPLDLKDTTFLSKEGVLDIMVDGYTKTEDGYRNLSEDPRYPHPSTAWVAGDIVTTVSDLMTFASALFDGKLVSKETLAVMAQPLATDEDGVRLWGLGGATLEMVPGGFGMGGNNPGYNSFLIGVLDTKLVVVALCNTEEGDVITPSLSALEYISQSLSGASDEEGVATEIQAPDYQKIIDKVLQDDRPGIALRVITPEFEYFETRGYVDWEKATPLEKDHLFRIASCTKTFIATLTLMMHFEGGLDLDDTITRYLPESITSRIQYADQITIRQMLNHTSGIFNTGDNPEYWATQYGDPTKEWTDTEVLEFALDHPANFEPGSGYAYSNTDYLLAGLILDQVLGHHHSADVRSRILEPLGLSSTFYEQKEPFDREMLSHGYFDFDGDGTAEDYHGLQIDTGTAAGGLISTAEDMATFIAALATKRDFPDAGYRDEFMQELLTIQSVASGEPGQVGTGPGIAEYDFGYGPGYGHSGGIPGYVSLMVYFAEHDVTFAMTWNGFDGGFADFGMVPALYEALIDETFDAIGIESTLARGDAAAGNVYEDPDGLFTMPLIGDWTPVETDGTYDKFEYADLDFAMSLTTIEATDAEGDLGVAAQAMGIDPASLTETYRGNWNKWSIFYYVTTDGSGVTILGQVQDGIGYYVAATGDPDLTANPPEDVIKTLGELALSGEVVLPATVAEFETYVNEIVGLQPPALSIAIAMADDVIYSQGFGMADRSEGVQATAETVYFWGSITKTVTATAIMQLREQELVDLDAPVSEYLDYFPAEHGITVWNLLTHSSGLPEPQDWLPKHLRLEGQPLPDADAMDREYYAELEGLMFEPGTTSAYANPDFVTLGQIVEAVSGQPYVEYVREHILIPLGMEATDFEYSTETMLTAAAAPATSLANREAMIAIIDDVRGLGDAASFFRETDEDNAWMSHFIVGEAAGGGLMGPATEMVRYGQMLVNGGELDGVRILSPESVELLRQEQYSTSGEPLGFGMAWMIRDDPEHPYTEHGGGGEGVDALLRVYYKDGFAIALQANSGGYSRQDVMDAAANVVLTMMEGEAQHEESAVAFTPPIVDAEGNEVPGSIAVIETVTLGGVEQTVTIRGADTTKPVLLFLHGGPGMPSSPWATWNNVHTDLEEEFVFVHWDQRGAGKSYSEELIADDMHMNNFVSDTLELTNILRERFNQEKIFLWGHSWGSGLGFETLRVTSEPYYAYIASAVRPDWNSTQELGYEKVLEIAYQANDAEAIQALESIQPFDPTNPEHVGMRGQFLSRYLVGDFHTEGLEDAWLDYVFSDMSSEYPAAYIDQTLAGHGFSRQTIGLEVMTNGYDHVTDFPVSTIPVYFIQGRYDYECPGELAEEYYDALDAPVKDFIWFENSAHDVYYDEPDKFNQELIRIANEVLASVQTVSE